MLYDLTSLQVDCNRKFAYSAEMTLNLIQSLYEKKYTTYPRVDTQYLSDDIYPKCPQTMNSLYQTRFGRADASPVVLVWEALRRLLSFTAGDIREGAKIKPRL